MTLRDTRHAPFCWQEKNALRLLRQFYDGDKRKRRPTAFAIYLVLTEIASDQYGQAQAQAFVKEIGERVGAQETTIKDYLRDFEAIGLIAVERRMVEERVNTANIYHLLTAPESGSLERPTPSAEQPGGGASQQPTPSSQRPQREELTDNNYKEEDDAAFLHRMATTYKLSLKAVQMLAHHANTRAEIQARCFDASRIVRKAQ